MRLVRIFMYTLLMLLLLSGTIGCSCKDEGDDSILHLAILKFLNDLSGEVQPPPPPPQTNCSGDPAQPIDLELNTAIDAEVAAGEWCFFRFIPASAGFYQVDITDDDGAGASDPDLYLSYLGMTPLANTSDTTWVTSETGNDINHTLTNYFVDAVHGRTIGVYGTATATPGESITFSVNSAVMGADGALPTGCTAATLPDWTQFETGGYLVSGDSDAQSPFAAPANYYYVLVNDTNSAAIYTVALDIQTAEDDRIDLKFNIEPNSCAWSTNVSTFCSPVTTPACTDVQQLGTSYTVEPGDYHVINVAFTDSLTGGVNVLVYTLLVNP